jgi:FtsP/CotA-like multicopper oxidase with cupredoxin domain
MVRKTLVAVLAFLAFAHAIWAQSPPAQPATGFTIRFYEKKVYFLGDEIQIEATVENTTTDTLRFRVPDNRYFYLDFDVRTTTNIPLAHATEFTTGRNSDQPVFFREVSLEPGERYSIVVDLSKFAAFKDAGLYVVQAMLYPDLFRGPGSAVMQSNRLTLSLKPPVATAEEKARVEAETGALIARQPLPPDEVVAFTIGARQKSQWEKYFLYLDLESLLRRNPERDRVFRRSSEAGQRQMLDQFRQQLMQARIDQEISILPTSFEVQKTTYDKSEATVLVLEKFKYPDYTELKQYTYHLKKSDRYWIIYDYEIRNQGTE